MPNFVVWSTQALLQARVQLLLGKLKQKNSENLNGRNCNFVFCRNIVMTGNGNKME